MKGLLELTIADPSVNVSELEALGLPIPAVTSKGKPITCADPDCGRRLHVGDVASCNWGRFYGRTGECKLNHRQGEYEDTSDDEIRAKARKRSEAIALRQANVTTSVVSAPKKQGTNPAFDGASALERLRLRKQGVLASLPESEALALENFSD